MFGADGRRVVGCAPMLQSQVLCTFHVRIRVIIIFNIKDFYQLGHLSFRMPSPRPRRPAFRNGHGPHALKDHPIRPPLVYFNRVTATPSAGCIQQTALPSSLVYTVTRLIYRANGCDRFVCHACARSSTSGQPNFPSIDSFCNVNYR